MVGADGAGPSGVANDGQGDMGDNAQCGLHYQCIDIR
jgi:hypothetical protein